MNGSSLSLTRNTNIFLLSEHMWLTIVIAAALAIRVAAFAVLALPVESDGLAYLTMANSIVTTGIATDHFGQHAFYSIGYPYFLTPFTAIFGSTANAGLIANLVLTIATTLILWKLALEIGLARWQRLAVIGFFAVWLPGIWNAAMIARENLSTPLLLLVLLSAIYTAKGRHLSLLWGGAAYGFAVLTGGSSLLIAIAPLGALILYHNFSARKRLQGASLFAVAAAVVFLPWMIHTNHILGSPVLNTNGGFNLYLGNNPAATGRFVSIADTPKGPEWNTMREDLGEVGSSNALAESAKEHMLANPYQTVILSFKKLGFFWLPNLPDQSDFAKDPLVTSVRILEVLQYGLIMVLAVLGFIRSSLNRNIKIVIVAVIAAFWFIHAAAYIIPRYRDPVIPVLILMAASALQFLEKTRSREARDVA